MKSNLLSLNIVPLDLPFASGDGQFPAAAHQPLAAFIKRHGDDKPVCLLDIDGYGDSVYRRLLSELGEQRIIYSNRPDYFQRPNGPERVFLDMDCKYVIPVCKPDLHDYQKIAVYTKLHFTGKPVLVLPFLSNNDLGCTDQETGVAANLGPANPVVFITYPHSGSHMFRPVLGTFLTFCGRIYSRGEDPHVGKHFIEHHLDPEHKVSGAVFGEPVYNYDYSYDIHRLQIATMDYGHIKEFHSYIAIDELAAEFPDTDFILTYRDPRDIYTSLYHRIVYDWMEPGIADFKKMDKQEALLKLITGMDYITPMRDFFTRIPSLETMTRHLSTIDSFDNVFGIEFAEARYRPFEAYKKLIADMGFDNLTLLKLDDQILEKISQLGNIEKQTGGVIKQDAGTKEDGGKKVQRLNPHMVDQNFRKGVSGDWRNHFSPKVKEAFKETAGQLLIELGYEDSLDW